MSTLNKAVAIESPVASISHLLPFEQEQQIQKIYFPRIKQAAERLAKAESEYENAVENRLTLVNQKVAEYLANPSERHGFKVVQVYPTNQQAVIQLMSEQGYMVHRVGMGLIYFISTKKNALKDVTDKATAEAEASIENQITRLKAKVSFTAHQHNQLVIEARKALDSIKPFESYLNVIVTDTEGVK